MLLEIGRRYFTPSSRQWAEHFRFKGYEIEGLTPSGRATVVALDLNRRRGQLIRQVEEAFGLRRFNNIEVAACEQALNPKY